VKFAISVHYLAINFFVTGIQSEAFALIQLFCIWKRKGEDSN